MELRLRVETSDDAYEVVTVPWVIMLWERRYKTKASRIASDGLGLEDLAFMAWESSKLAGRTVPISFDAFAQTIKAVDVVVGDDATPTPAAPSAG
jgi:hypothetical protein